MFDIIDTMCAPASNPFAEFLDAAGTVLLDLSDKRLRREDTQADRAAGQFAIKAVLTVANDVEAAMGKGLTSEHISILEGTRRAARRFDLLLRKTAPEFLRSR